jgi:hypothetical protein
MEKMTKAAYARRHHVTKAAAQKWATRNWIVIDASDGLVDVKASDEALKLFRDPGDGRARRGGKPVRVKPSSQPPVNRKGPAAVTITVREALDRLGALDWTPRVHDWSPDAMANRAIRAAAAVGYELATSPLRDDGHFGGWQVRDVELSKRWGGPCREATVAGFGFEFDDFDVLLEARDMLETHLDPEETIDIQLDLLETLAFPFGPHQPRPPSTAPSSKEST